MNESLRELLLGYLLDALDEVERTKVEQKLATNERWRAELEHLETSLEPLAETFEEFEPPLDLVERTCNLIDDHAETFEAAAGGLSPAKPRVPVFAVSSPWSLADMVVAIGVCAVAALLFFPAISNSRYAAQLTACQNNLRQIGLAMADFSDKAGAGYFPGVPSSGNRAFAGVYAPILADAGYLTDSRILVCPAEPLSAQFSDFRIPTLQEIDTADQVSIRPLQEMSGGSYGYSLGVIVAGKHEPPRNLGRDSFPLMSDAPLIYSATLPNGHHWGKGLNMLFEDGHVQFLEIHDPRLSNDDPFRNRLGEVEAGLDRDDAVIGRSVAPPFRDALLRHRPRL